MQNPWYVTGFSDASSKKAIKQFSTKRSCRNNNLNFSAKTSLVVWGTNLSSSVGKGRFTKQESNMIKLPYYQKSIIIGLLLSDGWLTIASKTTKNARLGFKQSLDRASYVWFVFNLLSHYCSSYPHLTKGITSGNWFPGLEFFTRTLPCFTELHSLFYPSFTQRVKGTKIIPYNIFDLLTPVTLAHLIMGDGSVQRSGLLICTDSYSVEDVVRLINVLILKYRIECTIRVNRENQYRIYIKEGSMPLLRDIVKSHMCFSMLYKIKL
jgi:hypothetical protein